MGFGDKIIEMLLTIENIFKILQQVTAAIRNNLPIKAITENCCNEYTAILHNSPNEKIWKTVTNSGFKEI